MSSTKIDLVNSVTGILPSVNGGNIGKNLLINSGFVINNGNVGFPYVSAATLTAGATGHECWKAGASGGDYSFTQLKSNIQITIASGKSLIQVIEDVNVQSTTYVLSWTGTAQARYAVNSATPSGSYAVSPIVITGQTAGQTMSIEFNNGTLLNPQLEAGNKVTSYEYRNYTYELMLTQRYAEILVAPGGGSLLVSYPYSPSFQSTWFFKAEKYAAPTFTLVNGSWSTTPTIISTGTSTAYFVHTSLAFYVIGSAALVGAIATARI